MGWGVKREQGLSEVIGFLMIVALLGILFSMYLLYVVPIQGKDAEITHMKYVTQQLIDIKSDIDSLIINERINVPIARSVELGTISSTGRGSLSIIPIQSFIEAAGTLVVNEQMDHLNIIGLLKTHEEPSFLMNVIQPQCENCYEIFYSRDHFYVNYPGINTPNATITGNFTQYDKFRIFPRVQYYINETDADNPWIINTTNSSDPTDYKFWGISDQTDIILEVYNTTSGNKYQQTLVANSSPGRHLFDLLNSDAITITNKSFVNYTKSISPEHELLASPPAGMATPIWEPVYQTPHRLGSLQYWSQNRYWINQELLYEMGGLFVKQDDGVSIMLIPSLAVTPITSTIPYSFEVSLVDIQITDTHDVSGTKSAQIFAKVDSVEKNRFEVAGGTVLIARNEPNAKFLAIRFKPDRNIDANIRESTTKLWKRAFDQVKIVTQKTMSERGVNIPMNSIMKTYYIKDSSPTDPSEDYSANLLIGNQIPNGLDGLFANDYTDDSDGFLLAINNVLTNPAIHLQEFPFEYTKARVSLIMQSGAL